jgi:Tol biopolymer transport system component
MLERRIGARAAIATRPFDAAAIARTAIATAPPRRLLWNGALPMRASLAWLVLLTLLVAAVAGGALLAGALLRTPAPPPSALLAIGRSEGFFLANADGSDPRVVASDGPYFVPHWSADGTLVATTAVIGDEGNMLNVFTAGGSLVARIPGVTDLRWSPVAGALAISAFPEPRLQVVSPAADPGGGDTSNVLSLSLPPDARRIVGFDWAPDGRRLAVAIVLGADPDAEPTLWLVPTDGGPAEAIPGDGRRASSFPAWSPDGRRIAVTSPDRCDGTTDCPSIVRILDAQRGQRREEVENVWSPATVRWSPDGTMLAVDALMGDDPALRQREVFVYTPADNAVRRMTDTPGGRTWLLGWAPDGASLLISLEVGLTGVREAWQVDLASGTRRLLADDAHGVALQPIP